MGPEELGMEDPSGGQGLVAVVALGKRTDPSPGVQEEPRQGGSVQVLRPWLRTGGDGL